jgi:hypothetical protein
MQPMTEAADPAARHPRAVATVRGFAAAAGAQRVVALIDQGDERHAVMVESEPDGTITVTEGEQSSAVPADAPVAATPLPLPHVHAVPASAIAVDLESGQLSGPVGAIPLLGRALLDLARTFGGRSVATADFATSDPEQPITIAAREGEPVLLAVGEERFVLPESP